MTRIRGWRELPITSIRPKGWLKAFLERQRDGLTGHLEVAGYPFDTEGWRCDALPRGPRSLAAWWPYEQYAYWVDGMVRCGLLLRDRGLLRRARRQIDPVLRRPDADGYLGPASLKTLSPGARPSERWPHAVFFRAVMADYAARPNPETLKALIRHYLSGTASHDRTRNICNVEIMAWLYEQTGDRRLLLEAERQYRNFQRLHRESGATVRHMLGPARAGDHGPTYMELFKLGAVLYRVNGNRRWLKASLQAQRKLARDHLLLDGVPSATEHLRGRYSTAGHETCVIADYAWSLSYLLMATGAANYADGIERAIFNALPGAVTPEFKALQYFSGPNQVVACAGSNHHPHGRGGPHTTYRPNPATECCPGNVHRVMPNYIARMWLADGRDGIVAACYGPSEITIGQGAQRMRIIQETHYPFDEHIRFRFHGKRTTPLRFTFRIPRWCRHARAALNGRALRRPLVPGSFVAVRRRFKSGDRLDLHLPRRWKLARDAERGAGIEWGPLVFALRIRERWQRDRSDRKSSRAFPAWEIYPEGPWNYALELPHVRAWPRAEVRIRAPTDQPWDPEQTPYVLRLPARRIPGWRLVRKRRLESASEGQQRHRAGPFVFTPALPDARLLSRAARRTEWVELVPLGATRLRVAVFPVVKPNPS